MSSTARDRELVEELEGDGREAGGGDARRPRRRRRRASGRRRASSSAAAGAGRSRRVASVMIAERALAADEELRQRVAGDVLDVLAAGPDDRAVGHHDLERQHPVARLAVLHAAQAARVRAEVAADRAHLVSWPDRARRTGPRPRRAVLRSALMTPGWTTATRFSRSISRIRFIASTRWSGRPRSRPRRPTGRCRRRAARSARGARAAILTSSTTSAVVVGKATASGQARRGGRASRRRR